MPVPTAKERSLMNQLVARFAPFALFALAAGLASPPAAAEVPLGPYPDCGTEGGQCPSDYSPLRDWEFGSGLPAGVDVAGIDEAARPRGAGLSGARAWSPPPGRRGTKENKQKKCFCGMPRSMPGRTLSDQPASQTNWYHLDAWRHN